MKRFSFLQVVVLAALLVAIASCSAPMYSEGDPYEQGAPASVYYADPYLGGINTVIVERNPYTGQYYQVAPGYYGGGGVYAAPAYPRYERRSYGYGGGRYYNNQTYSNRNYNNSNVGNNNSYYKTYPQRQQPQAQQAPVQQRPQFQQQRQEAKSAIFGQRRF